MPKTIAITPSHYWPRGVPRTVGIPPFLLHELAVERWAERTPNTILVADPDDALDAASLRRVVHDAAAAIQARVPVGSRLAVSANPTRPGATLILAALTSGRQCILVEPGTKTASAAAGVALAIGDAAGIDEMAASGLKAVGLEALTAGSPAELETTGSPITLHRQPLVGFVQGTRIAWHSHRSLLAHALSLRAFLGADPGGSVVSTLSPCTWSGLAMLCFALVQGTGWNGCEVDENLPARLAQHQPEWVAASLASAASVLSAGRRSKKERSVQSGALLTIEGSFDPDGPITVGRALGCPALSLFGMAETGPILGSHPSWYLVESAGIPLPNVHLVPTDPRSGQPISTLWELVDAAAVRVWSPSVMLGYDTEAVIDSGGGRSFGTGKLAASDPNGMLYLLD